MRFVPIDQEETRTAEPSYTFVPVDAVEEPSALSKIGKAASEALDSATDMLPDTLGNRINILRGRHKPESVLEGKTLEEPAFDAAEAERMSRKSYVDQKDMREAQRNSPSIRANTGTSLPASDAGMVGRAIDMTESQARQATAGLAQLGSDVAGTLGADDTASALAQAARGNQRAAKNIDAGQQLRTAATASDPSLNWLEKASDKYAPQILAQLPQIGLAMLSGGITLPSVLSGLGSYADAREQGADPLSAAQYATAMGGFEAIGEKLGGTGHLASAFEDALSKGFTKEAAQALGKEAMLTGAKEIPSEEITYVGQTGVGNLAGINPVNDFGTFAEGAKDTAIVAAGTGAALGGAGAITTQLAAPKTPKELLANELSRQLTGGEFAPMDFNLAETNPNLVNVQPAERERINAQRVQAQQQIATAGSSDEAVAAFETAVQGNGPESVIDALSDPIPKPDSAAMLERVIAGLPVDETATPPASLADGAAIPAQIRSLPEAYENSGVFQTQQAAELYVQSNGLAGQAKVVDTGAGFSIAPVAQEDTQALKDSDQQEIAVLNRGIALSGETPNVQRYTPSQNDSASIREAATQVNLLGSIIHTAFGQRLIPVTGANGYGVTFKGSVFVDVPSLADTENTGLSIADLALHATGHEMAHALEQSRDAQDRADHAALAKVVAQYRVPGALEARTKQEDDASIRFGGKARGAQYAANEIVADVNGAMWRDHKFWARLYEIDNGSTMRRIAYKFMQGITRLVAVAKGAGNYDVNNLVSNVEAVREAAAQVWASKAMRGKPVSRTQIKQELFSAPPTNIKDLPSYARGQSNFEVAPDPNDKELSGQWNALPLVHKQRISRVVADEIVPKVLAERGYKGSVVEQFGSYLDDTNPSFALMLDEGDLHQASKDLGHVLSQDSMMNISAEQFDGSSPVGAVVIELGDKSFDEVKSVYDTIRKAVPEVGGQSYSNGLMVVLNYSDTPIKELTQKIHNALPGTYNVYDREYHSSFPDKTEYGHADSGNDTGAQSAVGQAVRSRYDHLRSQASDAIRREIARSSAESARQARPGGAAESGNRPGVGQSIRGAIHYSNAAGLTHLSGESFGKGIKGAEHERLNADGAPPELRQRSYFYKPVDNGIPQAETGLGGHVYSADLDNVYDPRIDKPVRGTGTDLERNLLAAGYKGYVSHDTGSIVMFGKATPVKYIGRAGDHQQVQRKVESVKPKVMTRTEGNELVRRPDNAEVMQIIKARGALKLVAPSFRMEYGEARVHRDEAAAADAALADAGGAFQFGEPAYNRRFKSVEEFEAVDTSQIDELGAFNLDAANDEIDEALSPEDARQAKQAELDAANDLRSRMVAKARARAARAKEVTLDELKAQRLHPENAFADQLGEVTDDGTELKFVGPAVQLGGFASHGGIPAVRIYKAGDKFNVRAPGTWSITEMDQATAVKFAKHMAVARKIQESGYDLADNYRKGTIHKLVATWQQLAGKPGMFTVTETGKSKDFATLAREMQAMPDYFVTTSGSADYTTIEFHAERGGGVYAATLGTRPGGALEACTMGLAGASSLGSRFYAVAAEYARIHGKRFVAASMLSSINTARRTEQALSYALKTGNTGVILPGIQNRVYGYNVSPKTAEDHVRNTGRLLLANLRNLVEIDPSIRRLQYDPATDRFVDAKGQDASAKVQAFLALPEARAYGVGRTTLARAVVTSQILSGTLDAEAVTQFKEPIAYARRMEPLSEEWGEPGAVVPKLQKYLGRSVMVHEDGTPIVMYHGTAQNIEAFRAKQAGAIFLSYNPNFADDFAGASAEWMARHYDQVLTPDQIRLATDQAVAAVMADKLTKLSERKAMAAEIKSGKPTGAAQDALMEAVRQFMPSGPNILPLVVRAESPFDYRIKRHRDDLLAMLDENWRDDIEEMLKTGDWSTIESDEVQQAIHDLGHDSFFVKENGQINLAVYQPNQVKSAIGNNGNYDLADDRIAYSRGTVSSSGRAARDAGQEAVFVDRLNRRLQGTGNTVTLVKTFGDLPVEVQKVADASVVGLAVGRGNVYIIQDKLQSAGDLEATIIHELYGHVGLRSLFGPDIYLRLNKLALALGQSKLDALVQKYALDKNGYLTQDLNASDKTVMRAGGKQELKRAYIMEELLAHIAEHETGTLKQQALEIIGAIKDWLRSYGFERLASMGMSDIARILKLGREAALSGTGVVDVPMFKRVDKDYDYQAAVAAKHERVRRFHHDRAALIERIDRDADSGKEAASVLRLMAHAGFRVGGKPDLSGKHEAYGAATLKPEHVTINGSVVTFDFTGKAGVRQQHSIDDAKIATDLKKRMDRDRLFAVNDRSARHYYDLILGGKDYKTHDFRTWLATDVARQVVLAMPSPSNAAEFKHVHDLAIAAAARKIGDTEKVTKESYVDPTIFDAIREAAGISESVRSVDGTAAADDARGVAAADGPVAEPTSYARRLGPQELKYQHNYLVPEIDGAFEDGAIAHLPGIVFARDGIMRTFPAMPVRIRVGEHQRNKRDPMVRQYGLQHRIENRNENPQDRGYVTPKLDEGSAAEVERAARDITLGVLDAQTAYADSSPTKAYLHAATLNRSTVLETQLDSQGNRFWSVVTSMPSTREQMMRRYKAPTSVVGTTLNGERTQQAFDIKRGILDKLKEPGQSPVTSESYILDSDGLLFKNDLPAEAVKVAPKQLARDANGRIILNKNKVAPAYSRNFKQDTAGNRFTLPGEGAVGLARRKLQDFFLPVLQAQEALLAQGGIVGEAQDVYRAEERSHGRVEEMMKDFKRNVFEPMVAKATKAGVSMDELALFAYAMHAPERNAHIAQIDPQMPDGGSGMTDADAAAVVDGFRQEGKLPVMEDLHNDLMAITATTRRVMLEEDLITQDEFDAMESAYQNYIPLRGFADKDELDQPVRRGGRGFNIRGKETMKALGRRSRAGDLLENVVSDYERATVRGERNRVGQTFLSLVQVNPDPGLWEIDATRTRKSLDRSTGKVSRDTVIDSGPDTVAIKLKGHEVYVKVHDERLLRALRLAYKDDTGAIGAFLNDTIGLYSTLLRNTLTRFNPAFAAVNAVRDFGMGSVAVVDELGFKGQAQFTKHYAGALAASFRNERGTLSQGNADWQRWFEEYRAAGGTTGGYFARSTEDIAGDIRDLMLMHGAAPKGKIELLKAKGGYKLMKQAGHVLEVLGSTSENAARVSAYRTAREMGKSAAEAASIAKNLTTNFNRKGEYGQILNTLFVFFNAAVQGQTRVLQALANPKVQGMMAAATAAGFMMAMANAGNGGDDDDGQAYWDKIADFEKERNFIIMLPPGVKMDGVKTVGKRGRYIKIPMPYGFNFFPMLGQNMADVIRNSRDETRGITASKAAVNLLNNVLGSFNPISMGIDFNNKDSMLMAVSPSIGDLAIQMANGVNAFGNPTSPYKAAGDTGLDSENVNPRQAGGIFHQAARGLNKTTGGNAVEAGWMDVAPGTLENLWGNATGGTGRFLSDVFNVVEAVLADVAPGMLDPKADITVRDIPILKSFYAPVDELNDASLMYERRRAISEAEATQKRYNEAGLDKAPDRDFDALVALAKSSQHFTQQMGKLRKQEIHAALDESLSKAERAAQIKEVQTTRNELVKEFNAGYMEIMREKRDGGFGK